MYLLEKALKFVSNESDMNKEYKGKVHGLRIIRTSAFGYRTWEVRFATGKAYFECSIKKIFPFALGDTIRFEGEWLEAINGRYFQITKVIDVNDCILWDMHEQQRMAAFVLGN